MPAPTPLWQPALQARPDGEAISSQADGAVGQAGMAAGTVVVEFRVDSELVVAPSGSSGYPVTKDGLEQQNHRKLSWGSA